MAGTRWPGRVGSQGRGDDNRRKLGLGGWGTHQVVVLGTGRLKSSPQVQRRTVCYSRRFQLKAQPGRFGTHKSWESDSLSQWEGGGYWRDPATSAGGRPSVQKRPVHWQPRSGRQQATVSSQLAKSQDRGF